MIAFGFTAFLTVFLSLVAGTIHGDVSIIPCLRVRDEAKRQFVLRVMDRLILGLSDQQLITGVSILLVGYIKMVNGVSLYHFSLIVNLGMFSCSAHLASVLSLRRYFQEHSEVAWIRITLMSTFAVLLGISLILVGAQWSAFSLHPDPDQDFLRCSASCMMLLDRRTISTNVIVGICLTVYLAICYWAAFSYVFPNAEIFFTKWLLTRPLEVVERLLGRNDVHERFMHQRPIFPSLSVSHLLQLIWWIASLILSTSVRLWGVQQQSSSYIKGTTEYEWEFGQILALFLLLIPFLNSAEVYFGKFVDSYHLRRLPSLK